MNVAVLGLGRIGAVTAASLAEVGYQVNVFDSDSIMAVGLTESEALLSEPGVVDLVMSNVEIGRLRFVHEVGAAVSPADVVWVCVEEPPGAEAVMQYVEASFPFVTDDTVFLVSSPIPLGTMRRMEAAWEQVVEGRRDVTFAYVPEHLRPGEALAAFASPDRVVIGVENDRARRKLSVLFTPFCDRLQWTSVESAEMTGLVMSTLLASASALFDELPRLCEASGADVGEVLDGLKRDRRTSGLAFLAASPLSSHRGLTRDVGFLRSGVPKGDRVHRLLDAVLQDDQSH